ncbi:TPA: hypothetical protein BOS_20055 [Bos taurus]|nr:TPA: hypothetical protein BOS_20055 [Bos taurus]
MGYIRETTGIWKKVNRTMALRQLYSAESTCSAFSFSTCSWKIRMWSIKATTRSADMGEAWRPAAARSGATWRGMEHWAAFRTNSSLQVRRSRATWSVICRSGKKGMFRAHSTALKSIRAASSQMFSMPMILLGCMHWLPKRDVGVSPKPAPLTPQNPRPRLRAAQELAGLPLSHPRARATDPRGSGSPAALSSDHHPGQLRQSGRPTGFRGPFQAGRPRTQHGPLCLGVPGTLGGMEHCGGHLSSFTAERLIFLLIGGEGARGGGGGGPKLGGWGDAFAKDTEELHPGRPLATPAPFSIPHTPKPAAPAPRATPGERRAESQGLAAADSVCSQEERGRRDRPAEARGSRARGGEQAAGGGAAREGRGGPARLGHERLSDAGRGESLSQKHKETRAFARRNPEPAPGAERAIGRARLAALGEFHITKTQLAQSESSRPRPLAHPAPTPYRALLLSKVKGKKKTEALFEAAVLALVAVVLVDGTVPVGAARVAQVPPHAALEEALAAFARELAVVLAARLVPAHHALDVLLLLLLVATRPARAALAAGCRLGRRAGRAPLAGRLWRVRGAGRRAGHGRRLRGLAALRAGHLVLGVAPRADYHCHIYGGRVRTSCSPGCGRRRAPGSRAPARRLLCVQRSWCVAEELEEEEERRLSGGQVQGSPQSAIQESHRNREDSESRGAGLGRAQRARQAGAEAGGPRSGRSAARVQGNQHESGPRRALSGVVLALGRRRRRLPRAPRRAPRSLRPRRPLSPDRGRSLLPAGRAAAGVGLARRARAAPSPSLAGARRPRHGGRGRSPVLARAASRPGLRALRGLGAGGGAGVAMPPRQPGGGWARAVPGRAATAFCAPRTRGFRPGGVRSAARTERRLLKAPREALDGIGDFDSHNLAMPPDPQLAHHPGLPAHLGARGAREREKLPGFFAEG